MTARKQGTSGPSRQSGDSAASDALTKAFTDAWIECMTEHDATLVKGPCNTCTAKHAALLREASAQGASGV